MKTRFLLFSTLLLILFTSGFTYAQLGMGNVKQIEEMKTRKLIVLLQPENQDVIKKLQKKGHADLIPVYQKKIEEFNNNLKDAVASGWKYHKDAEYKTVDEIEALSKTKTKDYVVIMIYQETYNANYTTISPYLDWNYKSVLKGEYDVDDKEFYKKISMIRVVPIEHIYLNKMPIAMQGLGNIFPNKADIIAGIYGMTYYIDYRSGDESSSKMREEIKASAAQLKGKTLLVRESDLSSKFPKESVKTVYPYKVNFVEDSVCDQAVIDRTSGLAFILTVPSETTNSVIFTQIVYDCETGKCLGYIMPSMGSMIGAGELGGLSGSGVLHQKYGVGKGKLDEKVFKKLADLINGK